MDRAMNNKLGEELISNGYKRAILINNIEHRRNDHYLFQLGTREIVINRFWPNCLTVEIYDKLDISYSAYMQVTLNESDNELDIHRYTHHFVNSETQVHNYIWDDPFCYRGRNFNTPQELLDIIWSADELTYDEPYMLPPS
jgi:hypothetical protein